MRPLPLLVLALYLPAASYAQAPQLDRIDTVSFGIYQGDVARRIAAPNLASGQRDVLSHILLIQETRTVPLRRGTSFGFFYKLVGTPTGEEVPLTFVGIAPAPGLRKPGSKQAVTRDEYTEFVALGETYGFFNVFEEPWELLPGVWTFEIWYEGRKMAEQSFTAQ